MTTNHVTRNWDKAKSLPPHTHPARHGFSALLAAALAASAFGALAADGPIWIGGSGPARAPLKFAVISDPHFYDARLGTSGAAFEAYLAQDPKLLRESEAILQAALRDIVRQKVQFLIVPGDLTKDGELLNHLRVAGYLGWLEQQGIQILVVPGNHDINNHEAAAYCDDTTRPVRTVTPEQFRWIYHRFGYGQARDHAPDSLSYLAEPRKGIWLLALDSCKYAESEQLGHPVVSGRLTPATLQWALGKIQQGQAAGKTVLAFMHHGVNPDFLAQPLLFPDYLVDDWAGVSTQLAGAGLRVIFTGHYHAQDASYLTLPDGTPVPTLCDVETSSLIGYPCAYRIVTRGTDGLLHIESRRVTEIEADTGGMPFQAYAEAFLRARVPAIATYQLMTQFGLTQEQASQLAPFVTDAVVAGYAGDEMPDAQTQAILNSFVQSPEPLHTLGLLLWGLWTDPPPADNQLALPFAP